MSIIVLLLKKKSNRRQPIAERWVFVKTLIANNIIHNLSIVVNSNLPANENEVHESCSYDRFRKFADKKSAAVKIANKLFMIGELKRGVLMKACNSVMDIYTC